MHFGYHCLAYLFKHIFAIHFGLSIMGNVFIFNFGMQLDGRCFIIIIFIILDQAQGHIGCEIRNRPPYCASRPVFVSFSVRILSKNARMRRATRTNWTIKFHICCQCGRTIHVRLNHTSPPQTRVVSVKSWRAPSRAQDSRERLRRSDVWEGILLLATALGRSTFSAVWRAPCTGPGFDSSHIPVKFRSRSKNYQP